MDGRKKRLDIAKAEKKHYSRMLELSVTETVKQGLRLQIEEADVLIKHHTAKMIQKEKADVLFKNHADKRKGGKRE